MPAPALIEGAWQNHYVSANGARFHVALGEHFAPARPLVVLLHGFPQFWWAWRHVIPALDAAGHAVAALDLRGHGASDKTPRGYRPAELAADVAGVIRALGFDRATLVGHDWGGFAAWVSVAYAPGVVSALAAVAGPHPLTRPTGPGLVRLARARTPLLGPHLLMAHDGRNVERLLRSGAADADFLTAQEARVYRSALSRWPAPHRALAHPRAFVRLMLSPAGAAFRRQLRQPVTVPVLSVRGDLDPIVPLDRVTATGTHCAAGHEVVSLPGVGHFPAEEAPGALNAALLEWLARVG